ncbi:plasmid pRiA4b ORF-3 family protein [Chloroflexota bacterium]
MATNGRAVDDTIYQIKVTIEGSRPPIWRRLLVHSDTPLSSLHEIIQAAFGWEGSHLHQFIDGHTYYGQPDPEYPLDIDMRDEQGVTLAQIATGEGAKFRYEYDFGDSWLHQILVEEVLRPEPDQDYPVCVKGRRACPPEDVGGIGGYAWFLEAISDPDHEEHESYSQWIGGEFDPEAFDLEEANQALAARASRFRRQTARPSPRREFKANMELIDQSVVVIKPKQPMVDWVNGTLGPDEPLTVQKMQQDCTAILVPDLGSPETVLECLEPFKSALFEIELDQWERDRSIWPRETTNQVFDAWFVLEIHLMVWDFVLEEIEKE